MYSYHITPFVTWFVYSRGVLNSHGYQGRVVRLQSRAVYVPGSSIRLRECGNRRHRTGTVIAVAVPGMHMTQVFSLRSCSLGLEFLIYIYIFFWGLAVCLEKPIWARHSVSVLDVKKQRRVEKKSNARKKLPKQVAEKCCFFCAKS